jgi:N-acetylneuraminic acid mutarotase
MIAAGNKVFFAGGENGDGAFNAVYSTVDIYDITTNTWSVANLSIPRSYVAAATIGNKVIFAGGEINDSQTSTVADIYDMSTNTWSTHSLAQARASISAVTVGGEVWFAGGHVTNYYNYEPSNVVDIYEYQTNSWSSTPMSIPGDVTGIEAGGKLYWSRGCEMEIKNIATGSSTLEKLFSPGMWTINDGQNVVLKNNKLLYFRHEGTFIKKFDIYDLQTHQWSIGVLPQNNFDYYSVIAVNNTVYLFGGWIMNNLAMSNQVWKLEF